MEKKFIAPKVGDFYYNEGGSLILIYFSSFDVLWGYNFSSKKKEFYKIWKECDLLDGGIMCNSIRLATKIKINVEDLIRAATRIEHEKEINS